MQINNKCLSRECFSLSRGCVSISYEAIQNRKPDPVYPNFRYGEMWKPFSFPSIVCLEWIPKLIAQYQQWWWDILVLHMWNWGRCSFSPVQYTNERERVILIATMLMLQRASRFLGVTSSRACRKEGSSTPLHQSSLWRLLSAQSV